MSWWRISIAIVVSGGGMIMFCIPSFWIVPYSSAFELLGLAICINACVWGVLRKDNRSQPSIKMMRLFVWIYLPGVIFLSVMLWAGFEILLKTFVVVGWLATVVMAMVQRRQ